VPFLKLTNFWSLSFLNFEKRTFCKQQIDLQLEINNTFLYNPKKNITPTALQNFDP